MIFYRHKNIFITVIVILAVGQFTLFAEPNSAPSEKITTEVRAEPNEANVSEPNIIKSKGDLFNGEFAEIFTAYVNEQGLVDYGKLHHHRLELSAILARVAMLERTRYESWSRNEKIAFWINTYNTRLLDIIIRNYPIESSRFRRLWWPPDSIRHIPPLGEVGSLKWNRYKFIVMDEEFTLSEIEDRFFRKQFEDPRIFLALHCASLGGPPLRNEPFYGKSLDQQLDDQAKKYINSQTAIEIDEGNGKVKLSVVFDNEQPWFGMEFPEKYAIDRKFKSHPPQIRAVLNFISNYLPDGKVNYLETGNYKVEFKAYDWRLNNQ
ncbi:MAG: DUF547 domain-containing protein [Sedimentisphaerales bacterium]|nr:DUF547 domain-containing protein [Sedimentisphaerales bacterium]